MFGTWEPLAGQNLSIRVSAARRQHTTLRGQQRVGNGVSTRHDLVCDLLCGLLAPWGLCEGHDFPQQNPKRLHVQQSSVSNWDTRGTIMPHPDVRSCCKGAVPERLHAHPADGKKTPRLENRTCQQHDTTQSAEQAEQVEKQG